MVICFFLSPADTFLNVPLRFFYTRIPFWLSSVLAASSVLVFVYLRFGLFLLFTCQTVILFVVTVHIRGKYDVSTILPAGFLHISCNNCLAVSLSCIVFPVLCSRFCLFVIFICCIAFDSLQQVFTAVFSFQQQLFLLHFSSCVFF